MKALRSSLTAAALTGLCAMPEGSLSSLPNDRNDEISSQYQSAPYTQYC